MSPLAQLAVLASAAVDADGGRARVAAGLAGDAGPGAGHGEAALGGDLLAAFDAMRLALAGRRRRRKPRPRRQHGVLHRILDLILHRAIARPAACHWGLSAFVVLLQGFGVWGVVFLGLERQAEGRLAKQGEASARDAEGRSAGREASAERARPTRRGIQFRDALFTLDCHQT